VDVSLDELVSWDVLEQFMQDIPPEPAVPEQPSMSYYMGRGGGDDGSHFGSSSHYSGGGGSAFEAVGLGGLGVNPSLSHALWHQPGAGGGMAIPPLAQSWGADFPPGMLLTEHDGGGGAGGELGSGAGAGGDGSRQVHKQRFVWTAELHRRFESAVNTLGIDHAKPQAISQLMNCEGDGAPTRQNIKSHLQKYRLLMQKRGKAGGGGGGSTLMTPSASCASLVDQDEPSADDGPDTVPVPSKIDLRIGGSRLGEDAAVRRAERERAGVAATSAVEPKQAADGKGAKMGACSSMDDSSRGNHHQVPPEHSRPCAWAQSAVRRQRLSALPLAPPRLRS